MAKSKTRRVAKHQTSRRQLSVPQTWSDMKRLLEKQKDNPARFDVARRGQLKELSEYTGRPALLYASDFLGKGSGSPSTSLDFSDKEGFREICHGVSGPNVDVLLQSPGGLVEAAESIVKMLRARFSHIRFIVPNIAKSAATMMAMSGDKIWMDCDSELGPIDPQFLVPKADGTKVQTPAQAIIDQFDSIEIKIKNDPRLLPAYIPLIQTFAPALYQQAENALALSRDLVADWLETYMFRDEAQASKYAAAVAAFLGNHNLFKSHSRGITLKDFQSTDALKHVRVKDLASDPGFHRRVRAVDLSVSHTFNGTGAYKLFDNSEGCGMAHVMQVAAIKNPPR